MPAASVPQKACPFQNSNAAQPAQKTTSAMRRHNGLKKGCSASFIGLPTMRLPERRAQALGKPCVSTV